jgi:hypothetical protein
VSLVVAELRLRTGEDRPVRAGRVASANGSLTMITREHQLLEDCPRRSRTAVAALGQGREVPTVTRAGITPTRP